VLVLSMCVHVSTYCMMSYTWPLTLEKNAVVIVRARTPGDAALPELLLRRAPLLLLALLLLPLLLLVCSSVAVCTLDCPVSTSLLCCSTHGLNSAVKSMSIPASILNLQTTLSPCTCRYAQHVYASSVIGVKHMLLHAHSKQ
jgi:hypothetical protein